MQNRELSNKLASGEIASIKIGGTGTGDSVLTQSQIDARIEAGKYVRLQNKAGVDVNTILLEGMYYVDTNLPNSWVSGEMHILKSATTSGIRQEIKDDVTGNTAVRSSLLGTGTDWTPWHNDFIDKTYDYISTGIPDTGSPVVISTTTYTNIAHLVTTAREAGVYEIKFSKTFTYDSTNRSASFQWSINGGINWEEFSIEPKDATDRKAMTYEFPYVHGGGIFDIQIMGKCESAGDTLSIPYSNIVLERKK